MRLAGPNVNRVPNSVAPLHPLPLVNWSQHQSWRLFRSRALDECLELVQRITRARELDHHRLARPKAEQSQLLSRPDDDQPARRGIDLLELGAQRVHAVVADHTQVKSLMWRKFWRPSGLVRHLKRLKFRVRSGDPGHRRARAALASPRG